MKNKIKIIFNRSEIGAGTRGAGMGIDALLIAAMNKGSSFFNNMPSLQVNDTNHVLTEPSNHKWAKYIDALLPIYEEVCDKVSIVLKEKMFPLVISGDHASAGGTVAGLKKAYPDKRIGLIWIDAHADLHSPYTSPSGNVHGMPIATILNEDNLKFDLGDVKEGTKQKWDELKKVGGHSPKALPEDLIFIGVRDTEKEEDYLIESLGIKNYTADELRTLGVGETMTEIKQRLMDCDVVYVSFDVDSLDSTTVSMGTGTPVENGLFVDEAKEILRDLLSWDKVVALEVTEINPLLDDKKNKMAETALEILEYSIG